MWNITGYVLSALNLLLPLHVNYARLVSSRFIGTETEAHRSSVIWLMLSSSTLSPTWFHLKSEEWNIDPHILFLSTAGFPRRVLTYVDSPLLMFLLYPEPLFTRLSSLLDHGHLEIMSDYLSESLRLLLGGSPNCMLKECKWMNDLMNACVLAHLSTRKQRTRKGQELAPTLELAERSKPGLLGSGRQRELRTQCEWLWRRGWVWQDWRSEEVYRLVMMGQEPTCLKNVSILSLVWLEVMDSFIPVTVGAC